MRLRPFIRSGFGAPPHAPLRWVFLAWLLVAALQAQTPTLPWRWSNPLPHGNNVYDLAFQDGWYWQACDRGRLYASPDRFTWTSVPSGTTRSLRGVTFAGAQVIVSGEAGTILRGSLAAGFAPASVTPATTDWFEGVAASPDVLVAVGDNAAIYRSTDARANWQRVTGLPFSDWLRGVTYGGSTFVAVGENGLIATSGDGTTWRKRTSGVATALNRATYWNGAFMVVGDTGVLLTSGAQGVSWSPEQTGTTNNLYTYAQSGVTRLVAGEGALRLKTSGGRSWEDQLADASPLPAPTWDYFASVWDGNRFFLAGRTGMMVESFVTNTITGTLWFEAAASPRDWLWDVLALPRQYITVGDRAQVMTSENGGTWYSENVPAALTNAVFLGLGGSSNRVVAVGSDGALMVSQRSVTNLVTTNAVVAFTDCAWVTNTVVTTNEVNLLGLRWTAVVPSPTKNTLQGVCERDGRFVVVGDLGTVLTSLDGVTWSGQTLAGQPNLSSVAAGPGGFVATGQAGVILSSPDAVGWSPRVSGTTNWIYRVRAANGGFVAVGQNGTILTSLDGGLWTPRSSGTTAWLTDVAHASGRYFVAGTQGTVLVSSNLLEWTPVSGITSKSLYGLTTRGSQLLVVGVEGVVVRALLDEAAPITIAAYAHESCPTARVDRFTFRGQVDQRFSLEASEDLKTWHPVDEFELEFEEQAEFVLRTNLVPASAESFRVAPPAP